MYYIPEKLYCYDYIERPQKEYEIDKSIFPLYAIQLESTLIGLFFSRNCLIDIPFSMWFGKYDYKKNALYWEIKLPCEYSKARRLDFNRYIYNITKLNDKLLSFC